MGHIKQIHHVIILLFMTMAMCILLCAFSNYAFSQSIKTQEISPNNDNLGSGISNAIQSIKDFAEKVVSRVQIFEKERDILPMTVNRMYLNLTDLQGAQKMYQGIFAFFMMLIVGGLVSGVFQFSIAKYKKKLITLKFSNIYSSLFYYIIDFLLSAVSLVLFFLVAFFVSFAFFDQYDPMRLFAITYIMAIIAVMSIRLLIGFGLALKNSLEERRNPLYSHFLWLTSMLVFILFSASFFQILGLSPLMVETFKIIGMFIVCSYGVFLFFYYKDFFSSLFMGLFRLENPSIRVLKKQFVEMALPAFVTIFVYGFWFIWSGNLFLGYKSQAAYALYGLMFFLSIPLLNYVIDLVQNIVLQHETIKKILLSVENIGLYGLFFLSFLSYCEAMGVPIVAFTESPFGKTIISSFLQISLTTMFGYYIWLSAKTSIDSYLQKKQDLREQDLGTVSIGEDGNPIIVKTRAETLLPLLKISLLVIIFTVSIMIILSALGINIGPLLAGAGVVGIAIGFGAQALVKDVVSGIFFLIDDAFRIGEYIEMDNIRGEVEKISLRSMQLRHHRGAVHTVPFGELRSITNYNRDWAIYKQELRVPYDTDLDKVRKIIKKIGKDLLKDKEVGKHFIHPLKSQGVRRIEDSALIIGTKFMCKPREQFYIRRLVYQKIQEAFANANIDFAYRKVQVKVDSKEPGIDHFGGAAIDEKS